MKLRHALLIVFFVSLCLSVPPLFAQAGTGVITGLITDPQGAVLSGAQVAAINAATQVRTATVTNSAGVYELINLIPGTYSVEVSSTNFKKALRPNILVQVSDRIGLNFNLELGSFHEVVTVTTEAPQLRTEDAQGGEVITESMIQTLVNINRDPFKLLILAGNVQGTGDRASGAQLGVNGGIYNGPADTRINGGRAAGIDYLVDGVPATGGFVHNVVNATPTEDDVQEFKVITNGISSEYGRLSGGIVELSTKSGTNDFHGQLFEYHKDAFLNANSWGNDNQCANGIKSACSKSNFRQNDFGFAVGGPVILPHLYNGRNRTFWFANAEWVRNSQSGNSNIGDTITEIERNSIPDPFNNNTIKTPTDCPDGTAGGCANLSDIGNEFYSNCAFTDSQGNCHQTPYPYTALGNPFVAPDSNGNRPPDGGCEPNQNYQAGNPLQPATICGQYIPISQLSTPILHYVSLMPHANIPIPLYGPTGGNYAYRQPQKIHQYTWDVRVDHVINDKQRIYGRFTYNNQTKVTAPSYPNFANSSSNLNGGFGASLHYDYTVSPTLILDFNTGGNYSPAKFGSTVSGPASSTAGWGFQPSVTDIMGNTLLGIGQVRGTDAEVTGNTLGSGNLNGPTANALYTTNFSYSASLTKILGRHTLKFGYDGRRYYDNFSQAAGSSPYGDGFFITGAGSFLNVADDGNIWGNSLDDANNMGTFLWGLDSWSHATAATSRAMATNYYATYLQDDFKVSKKLTVNVGIRWEMQTPVTERHNNLSVWDPLAPSPFTLNSCYSWTGALTTGTCGLAGAGLTTAQASAVQEPEWALNGAFDPGAIVFVRSPEHRDRTATGYHPWNFAPRLGFAYQVERNTVVRGSFGIFYLPIGNNITNYGDTPGVAYTNTASSESGGPLQVTNYEYGSGFQTIANAFPVPSWELITFGHNNHVANVQTAIPGGGSGGVNINSHMPHEYDWSFGIQRQLPHNWLVEATYSGNNSNDLQGIGYPSQFPKNLYIPANQNLYTNLQVPSPTAGQIPETGAVTGPTGSIQPLAYLEYKYPYFGPVNLEDSNIGTNHYESGNLRVQKRFSSGLQLLLNYTYSKALDDVGGPNESSTPNSFSPGSNGKTFQSVNPLKSVYGLAAADETHRIIFFYNYQLPFGHGRRWMSSPHDFASNLLEYVAGGWEFSGTSGWHSGTPFAINFNNTNADQGIDVYYTLGNLAPGETLHDLKGKGANDPRSTICALPCSSNIPAGHPSALNGDALANGGNAQNFTLGTTVPPNLGFLRNPSDWTTDIAIMKSFPVLSKDGSRYFQLRLEGQNIFNHPGLGNYDNNATDPTFGMITNSPNGYTANTERNIQISGRFVF
jgi:hypothetical protein